MCIFTHEYVILKSFQDKVTKKSKLLCFVLVFVIQNRVRGHLANVIPVRNTEDCCYLEMIAFQFWNQEMRFFKRLLNHVS